MSVGSAPLIVALDGSSGVGRELLGGKGWSIDRMRALGLPVPPAFALTTAVGRVGVGLRDGALRLADDVRRRVRPAVRALEAETGRRFGGERPLLVSVRSGAARSMPGMMDTLLNVGMTDDVERALSACTGETHAADVRRRFAEQFAAVIGRVPPADPWDQLMLAIEAVLASWHSRRAVAYRRDRGIPDDLGTAVTVQAMVFGNLDARSGTGVLFTRDPRTGAGEPYGEWLPRGQGEDLVSGRCDALPLSALASGLSDVHAALLAAGRLLERDGRDVQDIEFTVEAGTLWLLQSRPALRSSEASVRHAVQLCREGILTAEEASARVADVDVDRLLAPRLDPVAVRTARVVARGKPAGPGVGTGLVVTDADEAESRADEGVVLARPTTDPADVPAMALARAVVTEHGGSTSHAAVVCRELAVPCVVGCGAGTLDGLAGRTVTVDGDVGIVYEGVLPVVAAHLDDPDLVTLAAWRERA